MVDQYERFLAKIKQVNEAERQALTESREIWFVGIEPSSCESPESITKWLDGGYDKAPRFFSPDFKNENTDWRKWPVHQKISKVICAYRNDGNIADWKDYRDTKLYNDGVSYRTNLYPLCFPSIKVDDNKYLYVWDGIGLTKKTKSEYYRVCENALFPLLTRYLDSIPPPKMIVCFGQKLFFENAFPARSEINQDNKLEITSYLTDKGCRIIIRPHFSARKSCNSNNGLIALGKFLAANN